MRVALIISTYNRPDFLRLVLASVAAQSRLPDQVVIADDGSMDPTRRLLDELRPQLPVALQHCWQPDEGFRKTRILNRAIIAARAEYLIFVDGDMLLHREFVRDHETLAEVGRFTQGRRICLNARATARHLRHQQVRVRAWESGLNRRLQMIRHPWLMKWLSRENVSLKNSRGCNQAFWKADLQEVNGFEEQIVGWGREDTELCARLHHLGRQRIYARHAALAFHLFHPELSRAQDAANQSILQATIDGRTIQALKGLQQLANENLNNENLAA